MRVSAPIGNGTRISMGPVGWLLYWLIVIPFYHFIFVPLFYLGCIVVFILRLVVKAIVWVVRRVCGK